MSPVDKPNGRQSVHMWLYHVNVDHRSPRDFLRHQPVRLQVLEPLGDYRHGLALFAVLLVGVLTKRSLHRDAPAFPKVVTRSLGLGVPGFDPEKVRLITS